MHNATNKIFLNKLAQMKKQGKKMKKLIRYTINLIE